MWPHTWLPVPLSGQRLGLLTLLCPLGIPRPSSLVVAVPRLCPKTLGNDSAPPTPPPTLLRLGMELITGPGNLAPDSGIRRLSRRTVVVREPARGPAQPRSRCLRLSSLASLSLGFLINKMARAGAAWVSRLRILLL